MIDKGSNNVIEKTAALDFGFCFYLFFHHWKKIYKQKSKLLLVTLLDKGLDNVIDKKTAPRKKA